MNIYIYIFHSKLLCYYLVYTRIIEILHYGSILMFGCLSSFTVMVCIQYFFLVIQENTIASCLQKISEVAVIQLYKYTVSPRMCTEGHVSEGVVCLCHVPSLVILLYFSCWFCLLTRTRRCPLVCHFCEFPVNAHKVAPYLPHQNSPLLSCL